MRRVQAGNRGLSQPHIIVVLLLSSAAFNYLIVLPIIIDEGGRDAWIGVLVGTLLAMLMIWPVLYIMKATQGENLYTWLRLKYGRLLPLLLGVPIMLLTGIQFVLTLKNALDWATASYLPTTPPSIIGLLFIILAFIAAKNGLHSLAMAASILIPFFVILSLLLIVFSMQNTDFNYLLPVLEHGFEPVIRGAVLAASGISEFVIILLIQHHSKVKVSAKASLLLLLVLALAFLLFAAVIQGTASFGATELGKQRYIFYEEWRLIRVNKYVEHIDFLSVIQCFSGTFVRMALMLLIFGSLWSDGKRKRKMMAMLILCTITFGIIAYPFAEYLVKATISYFLVVSLAMLVLLTVVTALLVKFALRMEAS